MDNREWGIRVGPPAKRCRRGFLIPAGLWALYITIAMFWGMIYEISTHENTPRVVDQRWE